MTRPQKNPEKPSRLTALADIRPEPLSGIIARPERPIRVLLVEDEALNRRLMTRHLRRGDVEVVTAGDGVEALERLHGGDDIDVILLDLLMPRMGGEELLLALRVDDRFARLPVLVATSISSLDMQEIVLELGASDYLAKPVRPRELLARVRNLARLKRGLDELDDAERVILSLARTVEAKDEQTEGHCERLSVLSVGLGRELGLTRPQLRALDRGGVLHDIGKVGIPDRILFKNGPLTADEWKVMRLHPVIGDEMIAPLRTMQDVRPIVRHHHERWDGTGYPDQLAGEEIPVVARILQVVDVYDALRSERPYKQAFSHAEASETMAREAGKGLWDPELVAFAVRYFEETSLPSQIDWAQGRDRSGDR